MTEYLPLALYTIGVFLIGYLYGFIDLINLNKKINQKSTKQTRK